MRLTEATIRARVLVHPLAELLARRPEGTACHAVGGSVRDAVLDLDTDDLDLSVDSDGEALARTLAEASGGRAIDLGRERFASYRVVAGTAQADVWDRRGGSLHADLKRRDFTINSIACPLVDGPIENPFGGLDDLEQRILRATQLDCFERDPLRVLRLARFAATLDRFSIDPETLSAARAALPAIREVAYERVRAELERTVTAASTADGFEALETVGLWTELIPGLEHDDERNQLIRSARRLDESLARLDPRPDDELRLVLSAALIAGTEADQELFSRATQRRASALLADFPVDESASLRLFLAEHGGDWLPALSVAWARATGPEPGELDARAQALDALAREEPSLLAGPPPLLSGHEIGALLKLEPGPEIGRVHRSLQRQQALGRVRTRAEAEEFVRGLG